MTLTHSKEATLQRNFESFASALSWETSSVDDHKEYPYVFYSILLHRISGSMLCAEGGLQYFLVVT